MSRGPKKNAFRTIDTVNGGADTVCKFRGITLSYNVSQLVNFKIIRDMILGTERLPTVTVQTERKIKCKGKGGVTVSIVSEHEDKLDLLLRATAIR